MDGGILAQCITVCINRLSQCSGNKNAKNQHSFVELCHIGLIQIIIRDGTYLLRILTYSVVAIFTVCCSSMAISLALVYLAARPGQRDLPVHTGCCSSTVTHCDCSSQLACPICPAWPSCILNDAVKDVFKMTIQRCSFLYFCADKSH